MPLYEEPQSWLDRLLGRTAQSSPQGRNRARGAGRMSPEEKAILDAQVEEARRRAIEQVTQSVEGPTRRARRMQAAPAVPRVAPITQGRRMPAAAPVPRVAPIRRPEPAPAPVPEPIPSPAELVPVAPQGMHRRREPPYDPTSPAEAILAPLAAPTMQRVRSAPRGPAGPQGAPMPGRVPWSQEVAPQTPAPEPIPQKQRPSHAKQLLDFIAQHESNGNYNAIYGNAGSTEDLSQYTFDEVLRKARQRGKKTGSSATGRYQIVGDTLEGLKRTLGLTGQERFTPELQDRMGLALLEHRGYSRFANGEISPESFMDNLAKEWAALPTASGKSYYHGDKMGNKATTTRDTLMNVLFSDAPGLYGDERMPLFDDIRPAVRGATAPQLGQQGAGGEPFGWMPEGYGMDWIFEEPKDNFGDRMKRTGILAFLGAGKEDPEVQIAQRLAIAQAMKEMQEQGQVTPATRVRLAELKEEQRQFDLERADEWADRDMQRELLEREAQLAGVPADVLDTEVDTGTDTRGASYKEGGATAVREQTDINRRFAQGVDSLSRFEQAVQEGMEQGALGAGWAEGREPGQMWDYILSGFGSEKAIEDMASRHEVARYTHQRVMDVMAGFKGQTTDYEFSITREATVPEPGDGPAVWKKYFDAVRADLAGVLYANSKVGDYTYGKFNSKEEARSYVDRALDKMKGGRAAMGGESVEGSGPSDLMQYYD